jgi:medium-chain acyl-[acyl-carrier-protein] hydrolase
MEVMSAIECEDRSKYFSRPKKIDCPRARLIAFPYAGAGAVAYHQWASLLPADIELISIQYPGRGRLRNMSPCASIEELAAEACKTVLLFTDKPFYFFGHSMGGRVAFQTIRLLTRSGKHLPKAFIASACEAPSSEPDRKPSLHTLPDEQFIDGIKDYGGMPAEVLQSPDMLSFVLPLLRADMTALETWCCPKVPPLNIPMVVLSGENDPIVDLEQQRRWSEFANSAFSFQVLSGGHFFIKDQLPAVIGIIKEVISETIRQHNQRPQID